MPNRNGNGSDYTNPSERNSYPRHIKNTDNETTRFFTVNSDNINTANIPAQKSYPQQNVNQAQYRQPQSRPQQQPNYVQTPGRQQYYSGGNQSQQRSSQPVNQHYNQYGQQPSSERRAANPNPQQRQNSHHQRPQQNGHNYSRRPASSAQPQRHSSNGQRPVQNSGNRPPQQRQSQQRAPQQRPPQQKPPKQKKKKSGVSRIISRVIISLLLIVLIIFGVYSCTAVSLIKKLNYVETEQRSHTQGALNASYVQNILLIGTDGRTVDERGRSDTMILLSVNKETEEITLTSLMRDSLVHIKGHGNDKLNHAYAYGGPELLMDTIESNFMVRIDDYVMINFNSFASIIDSVGGIEIEVSDAEAQEINTILMAEVNELMGDPVDADLLESGGTIELNGKQALAYARIRHIGNADFERTDRQRTVITKLAEKAKTFNPSMITEISQNAIPQISTNMDQTELYVLSLKLPFFLGYDIEQLRIPAEGTYSNATADSGGSALSFDFNENFELIKEQVFSK